MRQQEKDGRTGDGQYGDGQYGKRETGEERSQIAQRRRRAPQPFLPVFVIGVWVWRVSLSLVRRIWCGSRVARHIFSDCLYRQARGVV